MKYDFLLLKFQKVGLYHIILAIIINLTMIMSYYIILSISIEQIPPIVLCDKGSGYVICEISEICNNNYPYHYDEVNSVNNWKFKHGLICERDIYISYITSTIYFFAIISSLTMPIISDKFGRKFTFRLEIIGNLISFLFLYFENSLWIIFMGVMINELFSHIFSTSMIYLYEYFSKNYYVAIMTIHNVIYGLIGLSISSYVDNYKETSFPVFIIVIMSVIVLIYNFTALTESPDWLLNLYHKELNSKYINTLKSDYVYVCKFNRIEPDLYDFDYKIQMLETFKDKDEEKQEKKFFSFISDHLRDRWFLKHFFLSIFLWIVNQIVFYGCITNLDQFGLIIENAYKLFFTANIISNLLVGAFSSRIGLYNIVKYISWVNTILLIILYLNPFDMFTMQIIFFMFALVGNFIGETIYLHIPELFPANIRSTSVAYSKIPSKVLLIISPFIFRAGLQYVYYIFIFLTALSPIIIQLCK